MSERWGRLASAALLCGLAGGFLNGCGQEPIPERSDMIVRIAGEEILYQRFEAYLHETGETADQALDDTVQSRLFDQFLDGELLMRLAVERGLLDDQITPRRALSFLLRTVPPESFSEATLRQYYEAHPREFRRPARIHLRQILVDKEEQALEAQKALQSGEPFAEVAARFSQGPRAHLGGDQGWLSTDKLPPVFAEAVAPLQTGAISGLIRAEYGFHIFQIVERSAAEIEPFDTVRERIRADLDRRREDELLASFIDDGRQRYKIQIYPENLPFQYEGEYATPTN